MLPVLRKLGAEPGADPHTALNAAARRKRPRHAQRRDAAEPTIARELLGVLRAAEREAGQLRDEYISTEHLLLALAAYGGPAGEALRTHGARKEALQKAVEDVRGPHRVTSQDPEDVLPGPRKRGNALLPLAPPRRDKLDPNHPAATADPPRHPGPLPPHQNNPS